MEMILLICFISVIIVCIIESIVIIKREIKGKRNSV